MFMGAREMAQRVMYLSHHHADLNLDAQHLCQEHQYGSAPLQSQHVSIVLALGKQRQEDPCSWLAS